MVRSVASFSSLVPNPPAFVIPVFNTPGGNYTCVQNLNGLGKVAEFLSFDPSAFYTVNVIPDSAHVNVGDEGIFAFWQSWSTVFVGNKKYLKARLSDIDIFDLPPFIAVEVACFIGSQRKIRSTVDRASERFSNKSSGRIFKNRIARQINVLKALEDNASFEKDSPKDQLSEIILKLQNVSSEFEWIMIWQEAWKRFGLGEPLFQIARWRIENFKSDQITFRIILDLIREKRSPDTFSFIISWLSENGTNVGWYAVWAQLYYLNIDRNLLVELAFKYLEAQVDYGRSLPRQWGLLWKRLWMSEDSQSEHLVYLAKNAQNRVGGDLDFFIETVVIQLIRIKDLNWANDIFINWLSVPRPKTIWVDSFMMYKNMIEPRKYVKLAEHWLSTYGRGMNVWVALWHHLRVDLSRDVYFNLAEEWLAKARINLKSWPLVFTEVLNERGPNATLTKSARRWVEASGGSRRNSEIERVARYLIEPTGSES